eukprot:maker-scaffold674_size113878-snap-gene-0.17 protein:Tk09018 transcript:maker-scaffold674_size113878-snap-gene-0.17-mRNA-1 annotation:"PREDICTED: uncharacterized protein LOC658236"
MASVWPIYGLFWLFIVALGVLSEDQAKYALDRSLFTSDSEFIRIPEDILQCYSDRRLWDRYNRLPSSVDSLVSILRKVEQDSRLRNWNPGRLATTLIHKFRFDGIKYDRCVDTSTGALPYRLDLLNEYPKLALIRQLLSGTADDFPEDVLSREEACSLHWMLSYSVNTTFRDNEIFWNDQYESNGRPPYGLNSGPNWVEMPNFSYGLKDCEEMKPISLSPWEMGVIWSTSGPLASGIMLSGLAAGLEPQFVNWAMGSVDNAWVATLAGDLGQTALMKRKDEPYVGPDGFFNSTICPKEFYMRVVGSTEKVSHLTVAEINGGIDGLIMGLNAVEWERNSEFTLSQILDRYYSKAGMIHHDKRFSGCDRYSEYRNQIDGSKLKEQAMMFGNELKHILLLPVDQSALKTAIDYAKDWLDSFIGELDTSLSQFGPCAEQRSQERAAKDGKYTGPPMDEDFPSAGLADVALILDTSIYSYEDKLYMKHLTGALASQMDIWTTIAKDEDRKEVLVQAGSFLEITEGKRGSILATSRDFSNKAKFACDILSMDLPHTGDLEPLEALEATASRLMARKKAREESNDLSYGKATAILLMLFGRMTTSDEERLHNAAYSLRRTFPDVRLLVATRWASESSVAKYVLFPEFDVFTLSPFNEELMAEADGRRLAERIAQLPGQIQYSNCDPNGYGYDPERNHEIILYALPFTKRYFRVHPRYFLSSSKLHFVIESEFNSVEFCWTRATPEEVTLNEYYEEFNNDLFELNEQCKTVNSGTSNSQKLTVSWDNPCHGKSENWCRPIYIKIIGQDSGGRNCLTEDHFPCRSADAAKVTIRHDGMTCGSARPSSIGVFVLCLVIFSFMR